MPFMVLLLADTLSYTNFSRSPSAKAAVICLVSVFAWLPLFGWQAWKEGLAQQPRDLFSKDKLIETFSYQVEGTASVLGTWGNKRFAADFADAYKLMEKIEDRGEGYIVIDASMMIPTKSNAKVWTAIYSPANFVSFPSEVRRRYIANVAAHNRRPGWVITTTTYGDSEIWLSDFDHSYSRKEELQEGRYRAVRYEHRL